MRFASANMHTGDQFFAYLRDAFDVPEGFDPIGAIALGYPATSLELGKRAGRREKDEVIHWGRW